ncbi:Hypothetical predicted protein, partial [Pelobates cultripes]
HIEHPAHTVTPEASTTLQERDPQHASKARVTWPGPAPPPPGRGGDPGPKSEHRRLEEEARPVHDAPVHGATMADGYTVPAQHHGTTSTQQKSRAGIPGPPRRRSSLLDHPGRRTSRWKAGPEPRIWWGSGRNNPQLCEP